MIYILAALVGFMAGMVFGLIVRWRLTRWTRAAQQERLTLSDSHAEILR